MRLLSETTEGNVGQNLIKRCGASRKDRYVSYENYCRVFWFFTRQNMHLKGSTDALPSLYLMGHRICQSKSFPGKQAGTRKALHARACLRKRGWRKGISEVGHNRTASGRRGKKRPSRGKAQERRGGAGEGAGGAGRAEGGGLGGVEGRGLGWGRGGGAGGGGRVKAPVTAHCRHRLPSCPTPPASLYRSPLFVRERIRRAYREERDDMVP